MPIFKNILIVDDDPDDQYLLKDALCTIDDSVQCSAVGNGVEALEYLDGQDALPDVIFMDISMPVMNGLDCLEQLRVERRYAGIPVVVLTAASDPAVRLKAHQLGATYLLKEISFSRMISALTPILMPFTEK